MNILELCLSNACICKLHYLILESEKAMAPYSSTLALENPMDGGIWWAAVHGVAKSRTRLIDFTFTSHFHALEKEMATHSSVLAWRIPGTGEPGGLLSTGSHRVGHDWNDLAAAASSQPNSSKLDFWHARFRYQPVYLLADLNLDTDPRSLPLWL